jgi:hypothetical protein
MDVVSKLSGSLLGLCYWAMEIGPYLLAKLWSSICPDVAWQPAVKRICCGDTTSGIYSAMMIPLAACILANARIRRN